MSDIDNASLSSIHTTNKLRKDKHLPPPISVSTTSLNTAAPTIAVPPSPSTPAPTIQDSIVTMPSSPVRRNGIDLEKGAPTRPTPSPSASSRSFFSRFTRALLLPMHTSRQREMTPAEFMQRYPNEPFPPTHLPPWAPLSVHDKQKKEKKQKKKERRRWCLVILIIILLFLLGEVIFLNVRVSTLTASLSSPSVGLSPNTSTPTTLSADAQSCLSQFRLSAPTNPQSYGCSSCLPVLSAVPDNYKSPSDPNAPSDISDAIQFCALKAISDSANTNSGNGTTGGNPFVGVGWIKDTSFCTWAGVTCGSDGKVSQLELDAPAIPSSFPKEMSSLTSLQSLKVTGNGQLPAGSWPQVAFSTLSSLQTLVLQNTGIQGPLPDTFASMKALRSISLVGNAAFGALVPPNSLLALPLTSLVINSQPSPASLSALANLNSPTSITQSLSLLSLTGASLTGTLPSFLNFPNLSELHLGSNNLTAPLPGNFPPKLKVVDLSGNQGGGFVNVSVPAAFCEGTVANCELEGSGFVGACGVCKV